MNTTIKLIKDIAADNGIILTDTEAKKHAKIIGDTTYEAIKEYFGN